MTDLTLHHNALLESSRCAFCAERVVRVAVLRGKDCPRCGHPLRHTGDLLAELRDDRLKLRFIGYGLVGLASFVAGFIPLLQFPIQLLSLVVLHVLVLRAGLTWLSPGRRVFARVTMKLWGAVLGVVALVINVAIIPLLGLSGPILAAVGPLLTAAYIEGSLVILRQRLQWESDHQPLQVLEWGLPAALIASLLATSGALAASVVFTIHALSSLEVPGVPAIARFLTELFA